MGVVLVDWICEICSCTLFHPSVPFAVHWPILASHAYVVPAHLYAGKVVVVGLPGAQIWLGGLIFSLNSHMAIVYESVAFCKVLHRHMGTRGL